MTSPTTKPTASAPTAAPTVLPERMQPINKILTNLDALSDAELLAAVLWTGTKQSEIDAAYALLTKTHGDLIRLRRYSAQDLQALGLDKRATGRLCALLEMENRLSIPSDLDIPSVTNPAAAAQMLATRLRGEEQEQLVVMSLDCKLHILSIDTITKGRPDETQFRFADMFAPPIRHYATYVLVAHNHPTGDPEPSPVDIETTKEMITAGKLLQITVLDHVIIGIGRYVSIRERGFVKFA